MKSDSACNVQLCMDLAPEPLLALEPHSALEPHLSYSQAVIWAGVQPYTVGQKRLKLFSRDFTNAYLHVTTCVLTSNIEHRSYRTSLHVLDNMHGMYLQNLGNYFSDSLQVFISNLVRNPVDNSNVTYILFPVSLYYPQCLFISVDFSI